MVGQFRSVWFTRTSFALFCLVFVWSMQVIGDTNDRQYWTSRAGLYRVSYTPSLDPIEINQIHSWVLHVDTATGDPVLNADIILEGGMPMHNHGLPTNPIVTQAVGDGDYRIEGMRFHMMGQWEIRINISAHGKGDSVVIPLKL